MFNKMDPLLSRETKKQMYFLITRLTYPMIADVCAHRMLNNIHPTVNIDYLFIKENERYIFRSTQRYCRENKIKEIEVKIIQSQRELFTSLIGEYPDSRVFAYLSISEAPETLKDLASKLECRNFHVEIRTP